MHTLTHTHTRVCTHTHTHPRAHTHTHTHTLAASVDGRDLVLPSGVHVTLLVREEDAYVSNQELCKIIPNINRNVMETIRSTYDIMVYPATKAEISLLKWIGVLGMKAGRALLYKITDVAKMFGYWHLPVSPLVKELCDGKVRCVGVYMCMCVGVHVYACV